MRESGEAKVYIGNGKVAWVSDLGVTVAEREGAPEVAAVADSGDDLPF